MTEREQEAFSFLSISNPNRYNPAKEELMTVAVTMTEAARRLGVSRVTVRRLVREGRLPVTENPLDKRQKLIPEEAIADLAAHRHEGKPRFESDGTGWNTDPPFARGIKAWIRDTWHRDAHA
jgi:excisionase family DNA binding protein